MVRVGSIQARNGEHAFGYLETAASRSGLAPDVPVHLFAGAEPGPALLVQAAVHGNEIIATVAVLRFVQRLDPRRLRGTVIAVPALNRVGFDLNERGSQIDGKDISTLFPGKPTGSVSERLAYVYFHEVIHQSDVMLEFHAGGQAGYERYVLFTADADPQNPTELERKRHKLVVAFGLDAAAFFPPNTFGTNFAEEAIADAGVVMFQPELGGGTGWFANGENNVREAERGIWNTLKAMRMIDGEFESDGPHCTIYNASVVIWKPRVDGLFIRGRGFGERLQEGELYGTVQDPYTGRTLAELRTPREGIVIPSGREWPTMGATSVGILGVVDRVVDRRTADLYVSFP